MKQVNDKKHPESGYLFAITSDGKLCLQVYDGQATSIKTLTTSSALTTNVWLHVAVVRVGNNPADFEFYVNGTRVSHISSSSVPFPGGDLSWNGQNPVTIGGCPIGYPSFLEFNGGLKEVRIYNRRLTGTEINGLYNNGCVADPSGISGLIMWVPLDEYSTLAQIQDHSSYGATGWTEYWGGGNGYHTWEWQLNVYYFNGRKYPEIKHTYTKIKGLPSW